MAEVIGPCSTLPGARHKLPEGTKCDCHPDRDAVARIQGETDSFGAELNDMCKECLDDHRECERTRDRSGICEWCKNEAPILSSHRDFEEGMAGRVYLVCRSCIEKEDTQLAAELVEYEDDWPDC